MDKCLDKEFRGQVYKNLIELGYDKSEAQKIVGNKYYGALKEKVTNKITELANNVNENNVNVLEASWFEELNVDLGEMQKMKEFI